MLLSEIAQRLGLALEGEGAVEIRRVASLEAAGPGDLTFLGNLKYADKAAATKASAIILGPGASSTLPVLRAPDAYLAFARAVDLLNPRPRPAPGVHATAVVAPTARLGDGVSVGPCVVVEDGVVVGARTEIHPHVVLHRGVRVGEDCVLRSRVTVREGCRLGDRVVIHDGTVIGADGFGFTKRPDGTHEKVPQVGIVVIEDDVEIQANACVDRATLGETRVGRGSKIDNLVQVGHNCVLGPNTILCSQVGLSGSTTIGAGVTIAGQVGSGGHLTIGDGATVVAQSGLAHDIPAGATVAGSPATDVRSWLRASLAIPRLPDLLRSVRELAQRVEALERESPPRAP